MKKSRLGFLPKLNLKSRIAIAVVGLVLITAALVTAVSISLVKQGMKSLIAEQQTALLSRTSQEIDQKITNRKRGLQYVASHIPKNAFDDSDAMQRYLQQYSELGIFFDNLVVFGSNGDLLANMRNPASRGSTNVADRKYFLDTVSFKKPILSEPFVSEISKSPIVLLTVPVLDDNGQVTLVLTGTINLLNGNFVAEISKDRIGKAGFSYISTVDGIVVMHPDPSRVLQNVRTSETSSQLFDRVRQGFEGTSDGIMSSGERGLFSFKRLNAAPWVVGSVVPESEAYSPLVDLHANAVLAAGVLALLLGPLAWWYIRRQIRPLESLRERILAIGADPSKAVSTAIHADDEIGELALAFDNLIRDRVFAEAKFQSSAEELRAATNSNPDVFFILQSERDENSEITGFRFRYLNTASEKKFGLHQEDAAGKSFRDLLPPSLADRMFAKYVGVVETGDPLQEEMQLESGDATTDSIGWRHLQVVSLADGVAVTLQNISMRKNAEIEMGKSRAFLQSLADHLPMMFYAKSMRPDSFGKFVMWNKAAEIISGHSSDFVVGKTVHEIFSESIAKVYDAHDRRLLTDPMPVDVPEHKFWRPDGTTRYMHTISLPIFDANDEVEYIIGISEDVTVKREQNLALRTRQAELQAVNDSSPLGLFMTDVAGNCVYVNRTYEVISGLKFEQVDGNVWVQMIHPDERDRAIEEWALSILQKQPYQSVHRFEQSDGHTVWVAIKAVPVLLDGQVTGYIGSVDDITARREAEQARIKSEELLRLIADNVPALIGYVDSQERFVFGNRKYEESYGNPRNKLAGMLVSDVLGADVYAQSRPFIREAIAGETQYFERLVTGTGTLRWERVSYVPDKDANGKIVGFISLGENITELKQAQHTFAKSEMRLRMITDNLPALIAYIDRNQHYRFCNGYYDTVLGLSPDRLIGRTVREVMGESAYAEIAGQVLAVLSGQRTSFERFAFENGANRHFLNDYIPDIGLDGKVVGYYAMVLDITARKEAELKQAASEKLLRAVTDNLPALVSFIDLEERFQFNNKLYEKWLDKPLSDITGKRISDVYGEELYKRYKPHYDRALTGETAEFEFEFEHNGEVRYCQAAYMPQFDDQGTIYGVSGMINDITALKLVENQLRVLARFDSLTGLPNRNQFDEKLAESIARSHRSSMPMAVMFLDIDHFKSINDTLGHAGGDEILREFSVRLLRCVRKTDTVCRLAGDEFVIILEGLQAAEESEVVAGKIIRAMKDTFSVMNTERIVTTSIGITVRRDQEINAEILLRRADEALYVAKGAGRDTFASIA